MRFDVSPETTEGVETICLRDTETGAAAHILPQNGGTVWRLALGCGTAGHGNDAARSAAAVLEADAPGELAANPGFRGRLLIPFNDRIPGGRYHFGGTDYSLPVNEPDSGCAVHGLVYDKPFSEDFREADDSRAFLQLSYRLEPDISPGYPFALLVTAGYHLHADRFELRLVVTNEGAAPAPITLGWHPYIVTPAGVDEARITCPAERFVEVDRDLLPTGARPPVSGGPLDYEQPKRVGAREIDIALERAGAPETGGARTVIERGDDAVVLEQSLPPFRYTQLYIPPPRTSIAVEPVSAATDAFNRPELGLRRLGPGERIDGKVSVRRELRPRTSSDQPT